MTSVLTGNGTGCQAALWPAAAIAAGKTGTTDKNNETWFVGYTPQLTTAVWVGTPLGNSQALDNIALPGGPYKTVFGASIAAPTWKAIMDYALAGQPNVGFPAPSDKVSNGDKVDFGSVAGQTVANATNALQAQGFTVTVGRRVNSNYRPGLVGLHEPTGHGQPRQSDHAVHLSGSSAHNHDRSDTAPQQATAGHPAAGRCRQRRERQRERQRERRGRTRLTLPGRLRRQPASTFRTTAATRPPSARPATRGWTAFMTRPICGIPRRSGLGDRLARRAPRARRRPSCAGR